MSMQELENQCEFQRLRIEALEKKLSSLASTVETEGSLYTDERVGNVHRYMEDIMTRLEALEQRVNGLSYDIGKEEAQRVLKETIESVPPRTKPFDSWGALAEANERLCSELSEARDRIMELEAALFEARKTGLELMEGMRGLLDDNT